MRRRAIQVPEPERPEVRFRRLYETNYQPLLAYALRRCSDATEAQDVTADTFLVLWRRLDDAPHDEEVALWLYGVARRVIANRYRTQLRGERLVARLEQTVRVAIDTGELLAQRHAARAVIRSLTQLREEEREILLLAAWEKLSTAEIAAVVGCTTNAAAIRLHRARKRLTEVYKKENVGVGHTQGKRPELWRPPPQRREE